MLNSKKSWIIIVLFIASIALLWGLGYWAVRLEVPWPGGEGGLARMNQPYFIESRRAFYIQQSLILSALLAFSLGFSYVIWHKKKTLIDKIAFLLMIWITISLYSITFLSFLAILPLAFGRILSFIAIVWGFWRQSWKWPLFPFFYSIVLSLYSIYHLSEWFVVYGD